MSFSATNPISCTDQVHHSVLLSENAHICSVWLIQACLYSLTRYYTTYYRKLSNSVKLGAKYTGVCYAQMLEKCRAHVWPNLPPL
jgi:hypothetical protein